MQVIYKYQLEPAAHKFSLELPTPVQILTIQVQYGIPMLWAKITEGGKVETFSFKIYGTGLVIPDNEVKNLLYISSYQLLDGDFVGHVFLESKPLSVGV